MSDHLKQWRRRFFAFAADSEPCLIYFIKEESYRSSQRKERGRLVLDGASVVAGEDAGKTPTELIITDAPRKQSYVLRAPSKVERDQWIEWISKKTQDS